MHRTHLIDAPNSHAHPLRCSPNERATLIANFKPSPVDTSGITLKPHLRVLVQLLARNSHEVPVLLVPVGTGHPSRLVQAL